MLVSPDIISPLALMLPEAVILPVKCDLPSISKSPVALILPLALISPEAVMFVVVITPTVVMSFIPVRLVLLSPTIFPFAVILPLALISPVTSNSLPGELFPIPTSPFWLINNLSVPPICKCNPSVVLFGLALIIKSSLSGPVNDLSPPFEKVRPNASIFPEAVISFPIISPLELILPEAVILPTNVWVSAASSPNILDPLDLTIEEVIIDEVNSFTVKVLNLKSLTLTDADPK